jgi:hypothetical protein
MADEPEVSTEAFDPNARKPLKVGFAYLAFLLVLTIGALLYAGGVISF